MRATEQSGVGNLFSDAFNEKVKAKVKSEVGKSHSMFKAIKINASYENKSIVFEFERHDGKQITEKQRKQIKETFAPILKRAISSVKSEMTRE